VNGETAEGGRDADGRDKDADTLLTFFDFPAEHWKHLRTSNVIESPFATVRLRQRVTKGAVAVDVARLRVRELATEAQPHVELGDDERLADVDDPVPVHVAAEDCGDRGGEDRLGRDNKR